MFDHKDIKHIESKAYRKIITDSLNLGVCHKKKVDLRSVIDDVAAAEIKRTLNLNGYSNISVTLRDSKINANRDVFVLLKKVNQGTRSFERHALVSIKDMSLDVFIELFI